MANPLAPPEGRNYAEGPFAGMAVGQTRSHRTRNEAKGIDRTLTLTRTTRDFEFDLADAHNAAMEPSARLAGLEWFVSPTGELKLGSRQKVMMDRVARDKARQECERQAYIAAIRNPVPA